MNKYTLKFINPQQELQYGEYCKPEQKLRITRSLKMSSLMGFIVGVMTITQNLFVPAMVSFVWSLFSLIMYIDLNRNSHHISKVLPGVQLCCILIPYANYGLIAIQNDFIIVEKIVFIWVSHFTVLYLIQYSSFLVNATVYINLIIMHSVSLSYIFGFNYYIPLFCGYAIFQLTICYTMFKTKRMLFKESLVNQSIWEMIDVIVKDKIIAFTYDAETLSFKQEICNQAANSYLFSQEIQPESVDNVIKVLLSQMHIFTSSAIVTLGALITQKYLKQNSVISINTNDNHIECQGYYINKKNKVQIDLYVQNGPKLKFILNITTQTNCQRISNNEQLFTQGYQQITTKLVSKLHNTVMNVNDAAVQISGIRKALNDYHIFLKTITISFVDTYNYTISHFNVVDLIQTVLNEMKCSHIIEDRSIQLQSDYKLFRLVLQIIAKYFENKAKQIITVTFQSDTQNILSIEFCRQTRRNQKLKPRLNQLHRYLQNILPLIGDYHTSQISQNYIKLQFYQVLDPQFI